MPVTISAAWVVITLLVVLLSITGFLLREDRRGVLSSIGKLTESVDKRSGLLEEALKITNARVEKVETELHSGVIQQAAQMQRLADAVERRTATLERGLEETIRRLDTLESELHATIREQASAIAKLIKRVSSLRRLVTERHNGGTRFKGAAEEEE